MTNSVVSSCCTGVFNRKLISCRNLSCLCSKRSFFMLFLCSFLFYFLFIYRDSNNDFVTKSPTSSATHYQKLEEYETQHEEKQFLINTTNCKIPEFIPWSESASSLLEKKCAKYFLGDPKCEEKDQYSWTYVNGSYLFVNLTAVVESGYSQNSIRCCYRVITRVEQSLSKYDMMADRRIRYSKECFPVTLPKQLIKEEFIRVFCMSTSIPLINDVVTRDFFAIAQPDTAASQKISKWKQVKETNPEGDDDLPPNVIILGIDTMSRLNAYRNFNQTLDFLKSIGAIEMEGYTKVGETTFPNTVAFMSGSRLGELTRYCYKSVRVPQDYCPYLWKAFDKVGYLTATMEDVPLGTSFNFLKAGFVRKPTDFYLRPMMLEIGRAHV